MQFEINGRITKKQRENIARELWMCNQIVDHLMGLIVAKSNEELAAKIYNNILAKIGLEEERNNEKFILDLADFQNVLHDDPINIAITVLEETVEDSGIDIKAKKMFREALKEYNGDPIKAFEKSALAIERIIKQDEQKRKALDGNKEKENIAIDTDEENSIFNPKKLYDITDLLLELDPDGKEF